MRMLYWIVPVVVAATLIPVAAEGQTAAAPSAKAPCLTDAQLEINKKLKNLGRSTNPTDPEWVFDPEYLVGTWMFEWDLPDTPLSKTGQLTGKMTIKHVDGCYYEGDVVSKGPDGPLTQKIQVIADPSNKYMVWIETDSRGFTLIKPGRVGGDLGGYFSHFWEVPPFMYKGHKIRMKGSTFFASPVNFRYRPAMISIDDGPWSNLGIPWFHKDGVTPPGTQGR